MQRLRFYTGRATQRDQYDRIGNAEAQDLNPDSQFSSHRDLKKWDESKITLANWQIGNSALRGHSAIGNLFDEDGTPAVGAARQVPEYQLVPFP
jgi:hypothetical protein